MLCCVTGQHTAYIAGRGTLEEEVEKFKSATGTYNIPNTIIIHHIPT